VRNGRLRFATTLAEHVPGADVVVIAVGTPPGPDGEPDLSAVRSVAEQIGRHLTTYTVVTIKSTVPVGTSEMVREVVGTHAKAPFSVVSNPEFLKEGDAVNDFLKPDRILLGLVEPADAKAQDLLRHLYAPFVRTRDRIQVMDARSAELSKYAANAILATRISFMNEIANLAERVGADVEHVRRALGADHRIGPKFLFPGVGFGGSCFPKDLAALLHLAAVLESPLGVVAAAHAANARQKVLLADKISRRFEGKLAGRTIAVWGLAFKPGTDDIREAPALASIHRLLAGGARIRAYDPAAMASVAATERDRVTLTTGMYEALEGADALALFTEWHEFRRPDFARIKKALRTLLVFDGRNIWDPKELREAGFEYVGIGRPKV
jgi:UDPglucose 6-dehydrogenase